MVTQINKLITSTSPRLLLVIGKQTNTKNVILWDGTIPDFVAPSIIHITEYIDLSLELLSDDSNFSIDLIWEQIVWLEGDQSLKPIKLDKSCPRFTLYEYNDQKDYPWRCGIYQYEIFIGESSFKGLFEVLPKNVDKDKLLYMHNLINSHVEGLIFDLLGTKKLSGDTLELDQIGYWKFFMWYKTREQLLLNGIRHIELNKDQVLSEVFRIESTPRKQTSKSIRWKQTLGAGGQLTNKFLNRKLLIQNDMTYNRVSKWRIKALLIKMKRAMQSLNELYRNYEIQEEILTEQLEISKIKLHSKQQQRMIHKIDIENLNTTIKIKQREKQKLDSRLKTLQQFQEQYQKHFNVLQDVLQSAFWKKVEEKLSAKVRPSQGWGHKMVSQIWNESLNWDSPGEGLEKKLTNVMRPTTILYEYYVFFVIYRIFESMGFSYFQEDLALSMESYKTLDGLNDGSKMWFTDEKIKVCITFNELIESDADTASRNETYFYSNEFNRKPDIRLDAYDAFQGLYLNSSMVIEVKYRPLYNILNLKGSTETMVQLSKYWAINYVDPSMEYHHNIVKQVICVYPGDDVAKIRETSPQGLFMQLYPQSNDEIFGFSELREEIKKWLNKVR